MKPCPIEERHFTLGSGRSDPSPCVLVLNPGRPVCTQPSPRGDALVAPLSIAQHHKDCLLSLLSLAQVQTWLWACATCGVAPFASSLLSRALGVKPRGSARLADWESFQGMASESQGCVCTRSGLGGRPVGRTIPRGERSEGEPLQQVCSGAAHSTELALSNGPAVVLWGEKAQLPLGGCREWKGSQGPATERLDLACWSSSPGGALQFVRKLTVPHLTCFPSVFFFFFLTLGEIRRCPH